MKRAYWQIAIDGHSSCGKSTLAKDLARELDFLHVDSGAMYRAMSWYLLERQISTDDHLRIAAIVESISVDFVELAGERKIRLNGHVIENEIREQRISNIVSQVARNGSIRTHLVKLQRQISQHRHVVMDGRDIGTVVFPDADIKLFLTADIEVRVQRRWEEMLSRNMVIDRDEIRKNLQLRDHIDSTREISPLSLTDDAITVDNSELNREAQLDYVMKLIKDKNVLLCL